MKIADILRKVADQMDQEGDASGSDNGGHPENSMPHAELHKVGQVEMPDKTDPSSMIPPLQQKIELLKKASGEANAFDDGVGHDGGEDELDRIKKIAGLTVMIDGEQGEMGE